MKHVNLKSQVCIFSSNIIFKFNLHRRYKVNSNAKYLNINRLYKVRMECLIFANLCGHISLFNKELHYELIYVHIQEMLWKFLKVVLLYKRQSTIGKLIEKIKIVWWKTSLNIRDHEIDTQGKVKLKRIPGHTYKNEQELIMFTPANIVCLRFDLLFINYICVHENIFDFLGRS